MVRIASLTAGKAGLAASLAGLVLAAAGCGGKPGGAKPPEPGDQAVARVDGQMVWASDVKREAVAEGLIAPGDRLDASSDLFHQMLDEVIDAKVLANEALKRGLDKDPLAQRRLTAARNRALEDIMVDSVVGRAVNSKTETALYQEFLKNQPASEQVRLRQVVVASEPDAEAVKKELAAGAAFESVALQRSTDADTRFNGGDLGEMATDALPQPLAAAVRGARAGQLVGPVKVNGGWAVLRVDERRPQAPPSLDKVRPQLIRFITYDQIKDLVLRLRSQAKIETLVGPEAQQSGATSGPALASNALTNRRASANPKRP